MKKTAAEVLQYAKNNPGKQIVISKDIAPVYCLLVYTNVLGFYKTGWRDNIKALYSCYRFGIDLDSFKETYGSPCLEILTDAEIVMALL